MGEAKNLKFGMLVDTEKYKCMHCRLSLKAIYLRLHQIFIFWEISHVSWCLSGRAMDLRFTRIIQVAGLIPGQWLSCNIGQLSFASLRSR